MTGWFKQSVFGVLMVMVCCGRCSTSFHNGPHKLGDNAHAECPSIRFCWLKPMRSNSDEEWAKFLIDGVCFDVCGFPVVLRSGRGPEFTGKVVEAVNRVLGVEHAFGPSFHPESQGYLEGRRKILNYGLGGVC